MTVNQRLRLLFSIQQRLNTAATEAFEAKNPTDLDYARHLVMGALADIAQIQTRWINEMEASHVSGRFCSCVSGCHGHARNHSESTRSQRPSSDDQAFPRLSPRKTKGS